MQPINCYLGVSAILFCIGLFGVMTRRNAVGILMSIELMLNAANLNLVAFSAYGPKHGLTGQVFAVFVITIAAAEAAVGLAIVVNLYMNAKHVNVDQVNLMKW
ncbi:MAG: NADH-quinone oxidoreductase subunit NuoK [Armatimonadota bacterium]|nr:NADH-quinone oxidoreductase subunit NuoK [Armatimonadota bacterium]